MDLFVLLAASHCCDVLHADSVLSSAERVGWPACLCQGACNLCASREERRGTSPAAMPRGILAAEQAGRTWLWTRSRVSWTVPGPCVWSLGIYEVHQKGSARSVFCMCWLRLSSVLALWQWVRGQQKSGVHWRQSPSFRTRCVCWCWGWLDFKNMPGCPGRLEMSASRENSWVFQICWLFITGAFSCIIQLLSFQWKYICCKVFFFVFLLGFFPLEQFKRL